jgi:pyruvate dehydrogenase E1 component beta subunit
MGGQVTVPLIIRTPIVSRMGMGPQHSQSLEAWFMHVPGLKIAIPSNAYDAKGLLLTALRGKDPVLFIENVKLYGTSCDVPIEEYSIPFGKARTLREGKDVTLVALSGTVPEAMAAAEIAAKSGIQVEVVDPRTLNPFDDEGIAVSLRKTGRLIIAHDAYRTCGVAAEISQRMMETAFDYLNAPITRVTGMDVPVPSGALHQNVVPNRENLVTAIESLLN